MSFIKFGQKMDLFIFFIKLHTRMKRFNGEFFLKKWILKESFPLNFMNQVNLVRHSFDDKWYR